MKRLLLLALLLLFVLIAAAQERSTPQPCKIENDRRVQLAIENEQLKGQIAMLAQQLEDLRKEGHQ